MTGFSVGFMGFNGFEWVFYRIGMSSMWIPKGFDGIYWVLPGFDEFHLG